MLKEFKAFAVKGNVIDLAVGVIIGAAFGKIVDSAVNDLIMPIVAAFIGHLDFSNFFLVLGAAPDGTYRATADFIPTWREQCEKRLREPCRACEAIGLQGYESLLHRSHGEPAAS